MEPAKMAFVRSAFVAAAVLGAVASGVALAQTTTPPSSTSSKVDDVSKWTSKKCSRAKANGTEKKEICANCPKQPPHQNLKPPTKYAQPAPSLTPTTPSTN